MKNKIKYIIGALICICVVLFGGQDLVNQNAFENNIVDNISENTQSLKDINQIKEDDLKIYFIDVGQADCILLEQNGKFMLIDAGNNDDGDLVVNYLKEKGVQKLDYIIATHAHEDHIGGMDNVINNFTLTDFKAFLILSIITSFLYLTSNL